ncbi:MAG: hypothetical protein KDB94_12950 [Acidobacteria bacterium]|nr:hypothetical protein [Acidobacteriota bacterium]
MPPSNFESVMLADAVVLGRVEAVERRGEGPESVSFARLSVSETLFGSIPGATFKLAALGAERDRPQRDSFETGRAGGNCVSCSCVYPYEPGATYLFLLQHGSTGGWMLVDQAFRATERIEGVDSPWLAAVREYLTIARDPGALSRRRQLLELRERAMAGEVLGAAAPLLAEDIDAHLASPHETKDFEELVSLYERAADDGSARLVLWALALQEGVRVDALFRGLRQRALRDELRGPRGEASQLLPVVERALRSPSTESVEDFVALFPRLGVEAASVRFQIARALHDACPWAPRTGILAVAADANDEELGALAQDLEGRLCEPAIVEIRRRVGDDYGRSDGRFRIALSRAGDSGVVRWAEGVLATPVEGAAQAAYLLAISPGAEADAAVRRRIEEADDRVLAELVPVLVADDVVARDERLALLVARLETGVGAYPRLRTALSDWRRGWPERVDPILRAIDLAERDL